MVTNQEHDTLQISGEPYAPTAEEIASVARKLWEARGCQEGSPEQDWYEAERQLKRNGMTLRSETAGRVETRQFRPWALVRGLVAGIRHFSSRGGLLPIGLVLLASYPLIRFRDRRRVTT